MTEAIAQHECLPSLPEKDQASAMLTQCNTLCRQHNDAHHWHRKGLCHLALSEHTDALKAFQRALKLQPGHLASLVRIGEWQLAANDVQRALTHFNQALTIHPSLHEALVGKAKCLIKLKRIADAYQHLSQAVALQPTSYALQLLWANTLHDHGQYAQALQHFEQAIHIAPDNGIAYAQAGHSCQMMGNTDIAEQLYVKAIQLGPENTDAYLGFGTLLTAQGKLEAAESCFKLLQRLTAPNDDIAIASLARLQARQNRYQESFATLQPLLGKDPVTPKALLLYCEICEKIDQQHRCLKLCEQQLRQGKVGQAYLAELHLHLARIYDRDGRYDKAFQHAKTGNTLASHDYPADRIEHEYARIREIFNRELFERTRSSCRNDQMVFIVGMPRSGTTLVEQILAAHPDVRAGGELIFLDKVAYETPAKHFLAGAYPDYITALTDARLDTMAAEYLNCVQHLTQQGSKRVTDKLPHNFVHLGLIALLFPQARIIHCMRNPLDTCLSCYFQYFYGHLSFTNSLEHLGHHYQQYQQLMNHWRAVLPIKIHEVRYEDLVTHTEAEVQQLLSYCELEWNDACLTFHRSERQVLTASMNQVSQPIYSRSVGYWKHYEQPLAPLIRLLGTA